MELAGIVQVWHFGLANLISSDAKTRQLAVAQGVLKTEGRECPCDSRFSKLREKNRKQPRERSSRCAKAAPPIATTRSPSSALPPKPLRHKPPAIPGPA